MRAPPLCWGLRPLGRGRPPAALGLGARAGCAARAAPRPGDGAGGRASDAELARDPFARGSRMPSAVHDVVGESLAGGPVLVQTPRLGYAAALACERCRTAARCPALGGACQGPLAIPRSAAAPRCGWCGTDHLAWACTVCGHRGLRAPVVGDTRTAEAGPDVPLDAGAHVFLGSLRAGRGRPAAGHRGGDTRCRAGGRGWLRRRGAARRLADALARPDLRSAEEAVRRWANAIGLVRPGGRAVAVGNPADPGLQALVRWDLGGLRGPRGRRTRLGRPTSGLAARHDHRGARPRRRCPDPAGTARGGRDPRAGARRRRRGPGRRTRAEGPRGRPVPGAARAPARSVGRQAHAVRVRVDPTSL